MSHIVSVHSYRGGTGKSNVSANLGYLAAHAGRRVAVLDTDLQSPGVHVVFGFKKDRMARFADPFPNKELWDHFSMFYGGVHAVALDPATGAFDGAGDSRRGGVCVTV